MATARLHIASNIGKNTWQVLGQSRSFQYTYDNADRLKTSVFTGLGLENYGVSNINYDRNGNILTAQRKGKNGTNFGNVDDLSYFYTGNKLNGIIDAISGNTNTGDFRDNSSSSDYTYYPNGSLASDLNRGINAIEYNTFLRKISKINYTDGRWIVITYDGDGNFLKTVNSLKESKEFCQDIIFKNSALYQKSIPSGRIVFENGGWNREFEYRDIWNNLRLSFAAENGNLVTKQTADYDAWGYVFNETSVTKPSDYKYQNQLRLNDFDIGFDLFKFRASDPQIGRLLSVDPLSESYVYNSVFALQENKFGRGVELEGLELQPYTVHPGAAIWRDAGFSHEPNRAENVEMVKKGGIAIAKITATFVATIIAGEVIGTLLAPVLEGTIAGEMLGVSSEASAIRTGGQGAKSSASLDKLNRSLASEAQVAEKAESIAGSGSKTPLRKAEEMAKTEGGSSKDYAKMRSSSYTAKDGTKIETHYEINVKTGEKFNLKTKINNEQAPKTPGTRYQEKLDKIKL